MLAAGLALWASAWRLFSESLVPGNPALLPLWPIQVVVDFITTPAGPAPLLRDHIDVIVDVPAGPPSRRFVYIAVEIIVVNRISACFGQIILPGVVILVPL
jgi:hypothetical protein